MGNDVRKVSASARAILLNSDAMAVSQDPLGRMGVRLGGAAASNAPTQVWYRPLENGDVAVALYNAGPSSSHPWHSACAPLNATSGGYYAPAHSAPQCLEAFGQSLLDWYCCNDQLCAGYNFSTMHGVGCLFKDVDGAFIASDASTTGYTKQGFVPPAAAPADNSVSFADVGLFVNPVAQVRVYDIWAGAVVAESNASSFTAHAVPFLGAAFLRLSTVATS